MQQTCRARFGVYFLPLRDYYPAGSRGICQQPRNHVGDKSQKRLTAGPERAERLRTIVCPNIAFGASIDGLVLCAENTPESS